MILHPFIKESNNLEELLQDYKELFDDQLGKYKFEKVNLKIIKEVKPIFVKPRPISLTFRWSKWAIRWIRKKKSNRINWHVTLGTLNANC